MDIIEELKKLNRYDVEFNKKCSKLAHDINTGDLNIVQLVETLGGLLTDNSPDNRELGTWILSIVLTEIDTNQLNPEQLRFISQFYADRLKDHHQVYAAVFHGILALTQFERLPDGVVGQILTSLFQNVACQQQQQAVRLVIYQIFERFLTSRIDELRSMGLDYVYGILSAIDGERDPKNLLHLFAWFPKFVRNFNLGHLAEEAFETVACYFPVDFKAPPQDSNRITRDDLAIALTPCLCAIPEFSEFAISLALEKLESSLQIAKIDSLELLRYGCGVFEIDSYIEHAREIWSQIHKELLTNTNEQLELACLLTLRTIIAKLSTNQQFCSVILKDICDTVKGNLIPDAKLFDSSTKLFINLLKSSEFASKFVIKEIVPILTNTLNITTISRQQQQLIRVITNFLTVNLKNYELDELKPVPLFCLKASIDKDDDLRKTGWESLREIVEILPADIRKSIYLNLEKILVIQQNDKIRKSVLDCFERLAYHYPDEIFDDIINKIVVDDNLSLRLYFEALSRIVLFDKFRDFIIEILIDNLNKNQEIAVISLDCLTNLLQIYEDNTEIYRVLYERKIVEILLNWIVTNGKTVNHTEIYENLRFILKSMIGVQSDKQQEILIESILPKIFDLSDNNQVSIVLLDGILSRLHSNIAIPSYDRIFDNLIRSIMNNDGFIPKISYELLTNLLNKCPEDQLQTYLNKFENYLNESDLLSIWITKALIVRNHQLAYNFIDKLVESLRTRPSLGEGFRILMDDNYDCLSVKSHCNRMLLYRQKFFLAISDRLIDNYSSNNETYLIGLGYLLEFTPKIAILQQFPKIVSLIMISLDLCNDPQILEILLQILLDFIIDKQQCIDDHLDDFLVRFIKLSTYEPSMKVRILSLNCLDKLTIYPIFKLVKHKTTVTTELGKCLDDKKRLVRKAAVEARTRWFLLDNYQ